MPNILIRMVKNLYIATTYLKLLRSNTSLLEQLANTFGDRLDSLLESDFIHGDDIHKVFAVVAEQDLDSWVLEFGDTISIGSHGPLGFAVLSAPNLQTAMQVLVDYTVIRSSTYRCELLQNENRIEFITIDQTGNPTIGRWLIEADLLVTQSLIEAIMAHPLGDNARISFTYPKPDYADELQAYYGIPCEFGAEKNALSIPASWGQISSPLSDPSSFSTNLQKCRELKLQFTEHNNASELTTVALNRFFETRISREARHAELPTLTQLASENCCSARTFARRLEDQGQSYKLLLAASRREYAKRLLTNTHYSVADIAECLAYRETANFVRAFKTWFDTSPAAWRRQRSHGGLNH